MSLKSLYSSFRQPPSEAGHGVAFLKLARAQRRRWEVLGEFAKYAFCGLKRKRRDFERSVLKYVSIKIPALTHSGRKSRVCVNQPDRLLPPEQRASPPLPFFKSKSSMHSALQARRFAFRRSWDACAARSKAGPVMGLRPLRGPPCIPPETPPKRSLQFPQGGEGTRLVLRELPSLATLAQAISLRDA